jgi:hypothetical protein
MLQIPPLREMVALDRSATAMILLMVVVLASTGLVAATINSVERGDMDGSSGSRDASGMGSGADRVNISVSGDPANATSPSTIDAVVCLEFLQHPFAIIGTLVGIVGLIFGTYRRYNVATAGLFSTALLPMVMFAYFMLTNCPSPDSQSGGGILQGSEVLSNNGPTVSAPPLPPSLIAVVFGGVVVVAAVALFSSFGDEAEYGVIEDEPEEPETADFARAAGRAADRIEETDVAVDNAVYRAWLEMTGLLNIEDPDTTAPRDFVHAATDVGLEEADVSELATLFNEVRYGGKSPENREERALNVLRNIERTYEESAGRPEEDG